MIEGVVNADYEAVVTLPLRGAAGQGKAIDAVIDTGCNGFLTLPPAMVTELGLVFLTRGRAVLANGSEEVFEVYGVTVFWDGQPRYGIALRDGGFVLKAAVVVFSLILESTDALSGGCSMEAIRTVPFAYKVWVCAISSAHLRRHFAGVPQGVTPPYSSFGQTMDSGAFGSCPHISHPEQPGGQP